MPAPDLTFQSTFKAVRPADQQVVSVRSHWTDDWTWVPNLHCEWAVWSAGMTRINAAQLRWRYGVGKYPEDPTFTVYDRLYEHLGLSAESDLTRMYVRVEFGNSSNRKSWWGTIELVNDLLHGAQVEDPASPGTTVPSGEEYLTAFGLENLLDTHRIVSSEMEDYGGLLAICQRGLTFNENSKGNRSATKPEGAYVFAYNRPDASAPFLWNTQDIVEYLLKYATPSASDGSVKVPWSINSAYLTLLPSWDFPELATHGRRTSELLEALVSRERLYSWSYYVGDDNVVYVKIFTFTDQDIQLDVSGNDIIPENTRSYNINFDVDTATSDAVRLLSSLDAVDQVIVQGERRTSTFSLNASTDGTLAASWSSSQLAAYNAAASVFPDYPVATEVRGRREANAIARSTEYTLPVFQRFTLPTPWTGYVRDGAGGTSYPAFRDDDPPYGPVTQFYGDLFFDQSLALLVDRDYSGVAIANETFRSHYALPLTKMRPFACVLPPEERLVTPADQKWIYADKLGVASSLPYINPGAERDWSCRVRVDPESAEILLEVVGADQHVIAGSQFVPLPEDDPTIEFDWREWIVTVTVQEDRYCEGREPFDIDPGGNVDALRIMYIPYPAGRQDYVVPGTVVGIDETTGKLQRSTSGGFVQDDSLILQSLAAQAYSWYGPTRRAVSFETVWRRPAADIEIGDYIQSINVLSSGNSQPVNGIVSEMRVTYPIAEEETPDPPTVTITTGFAELDPSAFVALMTYEG